MDRVHWGEQHHPVQSNVSDFVQLFKADKHEVSSCATPPQRSCDGEYRTPVMQYHKAAVPHSPSTGVVIASASGFNDKHRHHQLNANSKSGCTIDLHKRQRPGQPMPVTASSAPEGTVVWHGSSDSRITVSRSGMDGPTSPLKALDLNVGPDNTGMVPPVEHDAVGQTSAKQFQQGSSTVSCEMRSGTSTAKWYNISTIAECIIKEKDLIIEKQKLKRIQLEQQLRESEAQLRAVILAHSTESAQRQADELVLQEQEYERSMWHASGLAAASSIAKVTVEKSQLESKLGEAEREISGLMAQRSAESKAARDREQQLTAKLAEKDATIASLHRRIDEVSSRMAAKNKKLQSLRHYLADLPTADDHRAALQTVKSLQEELSLNKEHVNDLQKKADHLRGLLKEQEAEMKRMMERDHEVRGLIADQERQLTEYRDRENIRRASSKHDVVKLMADLAAAQQENAALLQAVQQHEQQERQHELDRKELEALQAALRSEADSLAEALRAEAEEHDRQVKSLTCTVWEVNQRKQDLMEELMSAKEKVAAAERLLSSEERSLMTQCVEAVVCCTENLERLLAAVIDSSTDQAVMSRLSGEARSSSEAEAETAARPAAGSQQQQQQPHSLPLMLVHTGARAVSAADEAKHLQTQLSRLDSVRATLNKLHRLMMNKYAEEMALSSDAECITQ